MSADRTPSAGLYSGYSTGESGWGEGVNVNWMLIEILSVPFVLSSDELMPPTSSSEGDRYLVPVAASGEWEGKSGKIALWFKSKWNYFAPKKGWYVRALNSSKTYLFNGTTWEIYLDSVTPEFMVKMNEVLVASADVELLATSVTADKNTVSDDKNTVAADKSIVANDRALALAYRNAAASYASDANASKIAAIAAQNAAAASSQVASYAAAAAGDAAEAAVASKVDTTTLAANDGSGLIGFLYSISYAAGTVGAWLKGLATSAGSSFIGFIQSGTGSTLRTTQDKLRDSVHLNDFSGADSGEKLTSAIARLSAIGGGKVIVPSGTHNISTTIDVTSSNIFIECAGSDINHDVGALAAGASTIFNWTGAAGGTMFSFRSQSDITAQKKSGGGISGVYCKANGAAKGLEILSWNSGEFKDLFFEEFTSTAVNINCLAALGDAADTQQNRFANIGTRNYTNTGQGFTLGGTAIANTSMNIFENIDVLFKDGTGVIFNSSDNNIFNRIRLFRAGGGTGTSIIFNGSDVGDSGTARANVLINFSSAVAPIVKGTESFVYPATNMTFMFMDSDNGTPYPTVETGASAWVNETSGVSYRNPIVKLGIGDNRTAALIASNSIATETVHIRNSSSDHTKFSDGTNTWSFNIDSSTGKLRVSRVAGSGNISLQNNTEIVGTTYLGGVPNAESLRVVSLASCVNRFHMTGSVSGAGSAVLSVAGTDTNIGMFFYNKGIGGWSFTNSSQQRYFSVSTNGLISPANYVEVAAAATTFAPRVHAVGSDSNINLELAAKGTGLVSLITGSLAVTTLGAGLRTKEGSNAKQGVTAAMVAGSVTVANSSVTASSRIFLSRSAASGTLGHISYTKNAGVGFTITSSSNTETSSFDYEIFEPA